MAGINIDGILQQAVADMKKQSAQEIISQTEFYLNKMNVILNKLGSIDNMSTLEEFVQLQNMQSEATATRIMAEDSKIVARNKVMLDGYHVLSELGAWVGSRQSTSYTVVVTSNIGVGEKVTWEEMPFEEFANMVDFSGAGKYGYSSSRLVLSSSETLLSQYAHNATSFGAERSWEYEQFDQAIRALKTDGQGNTLTWKKTKKNKNTKFTKWQNVTRGNTLEAFLRYQQLKQNNPDWSEERLLFESMNATMTKPSPFYQGGDIGNIQVKGDFATIANNSTIVKMLTSSIRQLNRLRDILKTEYNSSLKDAPIGSLSANISAALEKEINELIQKFVSGIGR